MGQTIAEGPLRIDAEAEHLGRFDGSYVGARVRVANSPAFFIHGGLREYAAERAMGNFLRHEYDRIDVVRVWLMIEDDLAPLKAAVEAALKQLRESEG